MSTVTYNFIPIHGVRFYPFLVDNGEHPSRLCLLPNTTGDLIVAKDHIYPNTTKAKKIFARFNTYIDFYIWCQQIPIQDRVFYEVIPPDSQKPHFDIDIDTEKHKDVAPINLVELGTAIRNSVIAACVQLCAERNITLPLDNFLIFNSSTDTKQSYHIVIDRFAHNNHKDAKVFYSLVKEKLDPTFRPYVDQAVYGKNQQFRLYGHHKINKNNIKRLDESCTWTSRHETPPNEEVKQLWIFEASLVSLTRGCVSLPFTPEVQRTIPNNIDGNEYYTDIIAAFEASEVSQDFTPGNIVGNILPLIRRHRSHCPICQRSHDHENAYIYISINGAINFRCRRDETHTSLRIGRVGITPTNDPDLLTEEELALERMMGLLPPDEVAPATSEWPAYCDITTISTNVLPPYPTTQKILAVKSPMDTQKTVKSFGYIRELVARHPDYEIVIVSTRKSFTNDACTRFSTNTGLPFVSYLQVKVDPNLNTKYFITQIESCYKDTTHRKIVIMDEFRSLLAQFDSGLHGNNLYQNRKVFEDYISNAEYLLVLDADLDDHCINTINALCPNDRVTLIHNTIPKRQGYRIIEYDNFYDFLEAMSISFSDPNNNVVVPTNSYSFGSVVSTMFNHRNIRFYSSQEDDHPEELADINNAVQRFNTLIYTSTLGSGVDINVEHFHEMFLYVSPKSCCARDVGQMIGRIRNLRNRKIHIFIGEQYGRRPDTFESVLRDINMKINMNNEETSKILRTIIPSDNVRRLFNNKYTYSIDTNLWTTNYIVNQIERNKSWNNMNRDLISRLIPQWYAFENPDIDLDFEDRDEWKKIYKSCKQAIRDKKITDWINARSISDTVWKTQRQLINNNSASKREKLEVYKHGFLSKFTPDTNIEQLAIVACDKKHPTHIRNCVAETRLTPQQLISLDNKKNPLFAHDKLVVNKVSIIKRVVEILGVRSSFDHETVINPNRILPFCNEITLSFPSWKRLFGTQGKSPSGNKLTSYMTSLASIIELWNGCKLKKIEKRRNPNYKIYPFLPELPLLVDNYILPHIEELSVDTTSEVIPEITNISNRNMTDDNTGIIHGVISLPLINDYYTNNNHTVPRILNINPILNTVSFPTIQQPYNPFATNRAPSTPIIYKPPVVPLSLNIISK